MTQQQDKFIIIDGSSLMYRAFFALPPLMTTTGFYTNAITGFANMLGRIIQDYKPNSMVVAFDKSRKTFRTEMFKEYKGTRDKTPEELKSQFPMLREFLAAVGIKFIELDNYEADDIIGTLATEAGREKEHSLVVTGDKDALQLINEYTDVLFTKRGINDTVVYDVEKFKENYEGLMPRKLIDLKALMGDKSDNIPGVAGIGEKTALKLITQFGDLDNLLNHIDEVKGAKLQEKLRDNQDDAKLSYELATICCEAPVKYEPEEFKITPSLPELESFCQKYELKTVFNRLKKLLAFAEEPEEILLGLGLESAVPEYRELRGAEVKKFTAKVKALKSFSIYPVLSGHMPVLKIERLYLAAGEEIFYTKELGLIENLLKDEKIRKVIFDVKAFYHTGAEVQGEILDIMLMGYLIDPAKRDYAVYVLADMAGIDLPSEEETGEEAYRAAECSKMEAIAKVFWERIKAEGNEKLYAEIELPLARLLADMENAGIYINEAKLDDLNRQMSEEIAGIETKIYDLAGEHFKINSPKQLGEILFNKLGLPALKKTKTGYSTNAEVLENLYYHHDIVPEILNYRTLTKLKSTYLDGLKKLINPETKRIHTTFNQTVTETGRLSSSEPNLQNIPVRTAEGKKIRSLFEPGEGYDELLSADYSQIELRVMAHMARDPHFLDAFNHNQDIHGATAAQVFKVPLEEVTPELRSRAKAVNFGIIYGISGFGLARNLGISPKEAGEYIDAYLKECTGVKKFMEDIVKEAKKQGYVTTLSGRRRYLPAIHSSNFNQRQLAERMAMNTPIQGTAADIIKIAMNNVAEKLKAGKYKSRILLQVHDELVLEVTEAEKAAVIELLKDTMEHAFTLAVPLTVDVHWGKNWAEAK